MREKFVNYWTQYFINIVRDKEIKGESRFVFTNISSRTIMRLFETGHESGKDVMFIPFDIIHEIVDALKVELPHANIYYSERKNMKGEIIDKGIVIDWSIVRI